MEQSPSGRAGGAGPGTDPQADPFASGMWPYHRKDHLGDPQDWRQDPAMVVLAPASAEDQTHVPFVIDATEVEGPVRRITVTIDYSPFPVAMVFHVGRALPFLGFGVKYEMAGPLRASAEIDAGAGGSRWSMGAAFVDALGGGCSAPAATHARPDWQEGFGEMRGRLWPDTGRLRISIRHPMDTGLADGIQAHHLTALTLSDEGGTEIARLQINEPLEENPALTFILPPDLAHGPIIVRAEDNSGFRFSGRVEVAS